VPRFVEAEIRNGLWNWYETEQNANVAAEISLETGRIDLIAELDDTTIGNEIKGTTPSNSAFEIIEQLCRYSDSEELDALYLVSNTVDDYLQACEIVDGPTEKIGVLVYPLDITPIGMFRISINCPPNQITNSGTAIEPVCVREPVTETTSTSYPISESEEWLHYRLWETYDGITEGALPNIRGNSQTINIDFLRFIGGSTATEIHANGGEILGYEAKYSLTSAVKKRTADQLSRYWGCECLSRLYLAVPEEIGEAAREWVIKNPPNLPSEVGVVAISDNSIKELVPAAQVNPQYDAFGHPDYPYHVGFGNAELPRGDPPQSRRDI